LILILRHTSRARRVQLRYSPEDCQLSPGPAIWIPLSQKFQLVPLFSWKRELQKRYMDSGEPSQQRKTRLRVLPEKNVVCLCTLPPHQRRTLLPCRPSPGKNCRPSPSSNRCGPRPVGSRALRSWWASVIQCTS